MLAARANQENSIYEQQQAAAAKPLNQGTKGLAPKTPSHKPPKTPFGKSRNDENATLTFAKDEAQDAKPTRDAFITPANPRNRAPLGNKTTNAKALKTPAALLAPDKGKESERPSSTKPGSPRLRRSKIKVHGTTTGEPRHGLPEDPEEREIEYMPPREVPLPETFEDHWPHELDFSVLKGKDLTRGWWSEFAPIKDENDPDLSDYDENCRIAEERKRQSAQAQKLRANKPTSTAVPRTGPSAAASKIAAAALGNRASKVASSNVAPSKNPIRARPTAALSQVDKPLFDRVSPRFTAAKAASNSTIGYSKGRVVSSSRRPPTDLHAEPSATLDKSKTSISHLLKLGSLDIADDDADLGLSTPSHELDLLTEDEDEEEVFQLEPVQDF